MKTPSDISKALVTQLKALRERHRQFQTRVKAADKAARERDEEAQKQNKVLTQRIFGLESELKEARESIEALRHFVELLPTVKTEFDSFEDDVESFERLGDDNSGLEYITSTGVRVDALEQNIRSITESSIGSFSDILHDSIAAPSENPISGKYSATISGANTPRDMSPPIPYSELRLSHSHQVPPMMPSKPELPALPPQPTLTNRERLELIVELAKQPKKIGDLWFIIPQLWFDDWTKMCEEKPDDVGSQFGPVSTSILISNYGVLIDNNNVSEHNILYTERADHSGSTAAYNQSMRFNARRKTIPSSAWYRMLDWYGCDSVQFPRLVTPEGPEQSPFIDEFPLVCKIYFLLPIGSSNTNAGAYTPQLVIPRNTLVKTVRSMILGALPTYPRGHSIELFNVYDPHPQPKGWYISQLPAISSHMAPTLLDWQSASPVVFTDGLDIVVSVKVLDERKGCMVAIDPFPPPACPPNILAWNSSCV